MSTSLTDLDCRKIAENVVKVLNEQNNIANNDDYVPIEQVIKKYSVSRRTLYRHINSNSLTAQKRFGRYWIKKVDLELFILRRSA